MLETTLAGVNLNQIYRQANGLSGVQQEISALVQACASASHEELSQCLEGAQEAANELIEEYKQKNGSNLWIENLQADLADTFAGGILGGTDTDFHVANWLTSCFLFFFPLSKKTP